MLRPQEVINERYQVEKLLGQGGMGRVYLADDNKEKQKVAIKIIHLDPGDSHLRFRREFRLMSRLEHPHVVSAVESGQYKNKPFLVMSYLSGGSLEQSYGGGAKDIKDTVKRLELIIQVCDALSYIHSQNIIHRDLKPDNIMLESDKEGNERVFLMDFGLAKRTSQETMALTQQGAVMGTIAYMSPEQAQGNKVDARSDLYALGCVLYWILIGEAPLMGNSFVETMLKKMSGFAEPPSLYKDFLPHTLDAIVLKLLAKNPADRYSIATDIITDLRSVQAELAKELTPDQDLASEESLPFIEKKTVSEEVELAQLFNVPLIGRDDVWQKLCQASKKLMQGSGNTFIVEAEMGMGISYLLTEFSREARSHGHRVLRLQHQQGINAPYQAWKAALSEFQKQHKSSFNHALKGLEVDLATILPELKQDTNNGLYDFPADIIQLRLYNAVDRLLACLAEESSLVLIADNSQLADEAALGLLSYIARGISGEKMLMVIAFHPNQAPVKILKNLRAIEAESLTLQPLNSEVMQELITALLGGEVEQQLIAYVTERAAGNPFFVKEILMALLKDKHIGRRAGLWEWTRAETAIPAGIEDILMQNLERLSEGAQKVASVASAIGRTFDFELLQELLQIDEDQLLDDLDELLRAKVIEELTEENYRFSHLILREILHERMMLRRKHNYHKKIANTLSERKNTPPETLADHYAETKNPEKAVPYALEAARKAEKVFANDVAERYFRLALKCIEKDSESNEYINEKAQIRLELGKILERIGKWDEAKVLYEESLDDSSLRSQALHQLGRLYHNQSNLPQSVEYLRKAIEIAPKDVKIYRDLGSSLGTSDNFAEAEATLLLALNLAIENQNPLPTARVQLDLGYLEYRKSNWDKALEWFKSVRKLTNEKEQSLEYARLNFLEGATHLRMGDINNALTLLEKAYHTYQHIGDLGKAASSLHQVGGAYLSKGDLKQATKALTKVGQQARRLGNTKLQASSSATLGWALQKQGNYQEALKLLEEAYALLAKQGFTSTALHYHLNVVVVAARHGKIVDARVHCQSIEVNLEKIDVPYLQALFNLTLGEVELRDHNFQRATTLLTQAIEQLEELHCQQELLEAYILLAENQLALKQYEACEHSLHKAKQLAVGFDDPLLESHIRYLAALCSRDEQEILKQERELALQGQEHLTKLVKATVVL